MTQRLLLVSQLAALCAAPAAVVAAQQRDTTARPADSLRVYTLPPAVVSVTRGNPPINRIPQAVQLVDKTEISRARPTWGLDEALATVPGVYAANRYNFSLDQRISIRGFGARSAFAVRGIKVLLDGIPQTLPDGQGQLTVSHGRWHRARHAVAARLQRGAPAQPGGHAKRQRAIPLPARRGLVARRGGGLWQRPPCRQSRRPDCG